MLRSILLLVPLLLLPLGLGLVPRFGQPLAVLFPPNLPAEVAVLRVVGAGGLPLRMAALRGMVLARGDDPDLPQRLRAAGALLVLRAADAKGCP